MYIASNDIKKFMPHPGWKIYVWWHHTNVEQPSGPFHSKSIFLIQNIALLCIDDSFQDFFTSLWAWCLLKCLRCKKFDIGLCLWLFWPPLQLRSFPKVFMFSKARGAYLYQLKRHWSRQWLLSTEAVHQLPR